MSKIEQNTTDLQAILDAVNALPEAGSGSGGESVETCTVNLQGAPIWIFFTEDFSVSDSFMSNINSKPKTIYKNTKIVIPQNYGGFPIAISPISNVEKIGTVNISSDYGYGDVYIVKDSITLRIDD